MINFFRKTRKKLADDNKPMKYMRYAVGEILLVVIGILIALQINNWNEDRKEQKKEKEYLTNIKKNLEYNIEFIKEDLNDHKSRIRSGNLVLDAIRNKLAFYDSLAYHIHVAPIFPNPNLSFTAYESLKSAGFDIIRNSELKNEILNLFEMTYSSMLSTLYTIENQSVQSGQLSFYLENFERYENMALPNNYDELVKNQKFINIIVFHKDIHLLGIQLKKPCLNESRRIIQMIDIELTNF